MLSVAHQDGAVVITVGESHHYDPLGLVEEVLGRLAPYGGSIVVDVGQLGVIPLATVSRFVDQVVKLGRARADSDYVLASESPAARQLLDALVDDGEPPVTPSVDAGLALIKARQRA